MSAAHVPNPVDLAVRRTGQAAADQILTFLGVRIAINVDRVEDPRVIPQRSCPSDTSPPGRGSGGRQFELRAWRISSTTADCLLHRCLSVPGERVEAC